MVMTGVLAAVISTPLNLLIYAGKTGNVWGDTLMDMLSTDIKVQVINTFLGEAFVDIPDKVVSFLIAFGLIKLVSVISKGHREALRGIGALLAVSVIVPALLIPVKVQAIDFESEYTGDIYDTNSGLDSVEINAVAQTKDGYMWVGSFSGLYRFDGYKFSSFTIFPIASSIWLHFTDSSTSIERSWSTRG